MPSPFVELVGAQVLEAADGSSRLAVTIDARHFNTIGIVHGAVAFTLADTGMGAALHRALSPGERCATLEIKINYFRPVLEGRLECYSVLLHRGRSTATLESTLELDGRLVAKATGTFAIFARSEPPAPAAGG